MDALSAGMKYRFQVRAVNGQSGVERAGKPARVNVTLPPQAQEQPTATPNAHTHGDTNCNGYAHANALQPRRRLR